MSDYPKGSEWRRWDLHLHTPDTAREDNFSGSSSDEKWENFVNDINGYVKDISVVGVTDYFSVDNYKKFQALISDETITKQFNLVLPNVELRITPVTGDNTPINIHCIFSPEIVDQLETRFFAKLEVKSGTSNYRYTRSDLIRLGKEQRTTATDDEAYKLGREQFVLSHSDLIQLFKDDADLRKDTIIVVSNNSGDGASGIHNHEDYLTNGGSQLNATRRVLYQMSDMVFSAQPNDRTFFLGRKTSIEDVVEKCGRLKPCVHGCDAHTNAKIFEPDESRYCWIKADPTFEGLKQIIDEPEDRVWIGEYSPESKEDYRVIDSIDITDTRFPNKLEINSDLVAIIGSRSSGKSTLLSHIAHAIDPIQVGEKASTHRMKFIPWATGFSVNWRDGHTSRSDTFDLENRREIIYIPQSYINDLADAEESSDADILKYAEAALDAKGSDFHAKKNELDKKVRDLSQAINLKVTAYFNAIQDRASLLKRSSQAGDKKGIEGEIKKLTKSIESGGVQITQKELTTYREVSDELAKLKVEESQIDRDIQTLQPVVEGFDIQENLIPLNFRLEHPNADNNMSEQLRKSLTNVNKDIRGAAKTQVTEHGKRKQQIIDRREKLNAENKSLFEKFTKSEGLKKQVELLKQQKENLGKIERILKEIDDANKMIVTTKDSLIDEWKTRRRLLHEFSESTNEDIDDVNFKAHVITDKAKLNSFIDGFINQRELSEAKELLPDISGETGFNAGVLIDAENIENSLKAIVTGKLRLKVGADHESAVKQLFANHEYVGYKITFEGDEYATMTPGKKALVVLKLILESSEGKCPVLIDQPEDDLDSRSIFDQVVPFLREKKKERQIILVSHNANMVVTTDSEQVIVANRHGKDSPNIEDQDFDYLTGSIENTIPKDISCPTVLEAQGVREHVCDILEGSEKAFSLRKSRYSI